MKRLTWEVEEGFYFPEAFGMPSEMASLKVTPQWTEEYSDDSLRLNGIYHVAANIHFQSGETPEFANTNYAFIEDLDMQDGEGYFEYAIPLHVDLPLEKVKENTNPQLAIHGVKSIFKEDGSCLLKWDASCSFEEKEEEHYPEKVMESSSSSNVFYSQESAVVAESAEPAETGEVEETPASIEVAEAEEYNGDMSFFYVYDLKDDYSVTAYKSNQT